MKVFLSYATSDRPSATLLATEFRSAGLEVWDPVSEVLPGDNWASQIGKALESSDAMVVLLSPEALSSPSVKGDIAYALGSLNYENRLIPVVVRPVKQIPWILNRLDVVDAADLNQSVQVIVSRLLKGGYQGKKQRARAAG